MRNTDKLGLVVPTNKATENFSTQNYVDNFDKIDNFAATIDLSKVDKITGKGLSTEDYTTAEKAKVANLPLDTNAQLADKVQNFKIKNRITNGNFNQGTTGWSGFAGGILSAIDNILKVTGSSSFVTPGVRKTSNVLVTADNSIMYVKLRARVINSNCQQIRFRVYTPTQEVTINSPVLNQWYSISGRFTGNIASFIEVVHIYATTDLANGAVMEIEKVISCDLTNIFGAGNEPTKLEMDELMKVIPNNWWDGELTLTQNQFITWQLSLTRKNTNAIIALGGTII